MASSSKVVECPLCFESYNDEELCPRLLSCGHTYCSDCLTRLLIGGYVECPLDRRVIRVTDGIQSLPKNFALLDVVPAKRLKISPNQVRYCEVCEEGDHAADSFCRDCAQAMCQAMAKAHSKLQACKSHVVFPVSEMAKVLHGSSVFCIVHNQPYRYFDRHCMQVICMDCFALTHAGHTCMTLSAAASLYKQDIDWEFKYAKRRVEILKGFKEDISKLLHRLERRYQDASSSMEGTFEQAFTRLLARKDELVSQMRCSYKQKYAMLREKLDKLESTQNCLLNAIDRLEVARQSERNSVLLLAFNDICKTLEDSETTVKASGDQPTTDDFLDFSADTQILFGVVDKFGSVSDKVVVLTGEIQSLCQEEASSGEAKIISSNATVVPTHTVDSADDYDAYEHNNNDDDSQVWGVAQEASEDPVYVDDQELVFRPGGDDG